MTIALVQEGPGGSNGGEQFTNPFTVGNVIIACYTDDSVSVPSDVVPDVYTPPSTDSGQTVTKIRHVDCANTLSNLNFALFWVKNSVSGTQGMGSSPTGAGQIHKASEWSGIDFDAGVLAHAGSSSPTNTNQTSFDTGSAGTCPAGGLIVACYDGIGSGGRGTAVFNAGEGWTNFTSFQPGTAHSVQMAYKFTTAPTDIRATGTMAVSSYWGAIVAAFRPVGGFPSSKGLLMAAGMV
jgi:hypothetical protein